MSIFTRRVLACIKGWWHKFNEITSRDGSPKSDAKPPYTHCLNCNTELTGIYCHKCGQYASLPANNMSTFAKEYIKNTLAVESQVFPTLSNLIFHPGRVPKEYSKGHFVSYLNPLKLNLFILIILITLFSLIGTDAKVETMLSEASEKEGFAVALTLSSVESDLEKSELLKEAPRDTLAIIAPTQILQSYRKSVTIIEPISAKDQSNTDTILVAIPRFIVEEGMLKRSGQYYNFESKPITVNSKQIDYNHIAKKWEEATSTLFNHFPLLMLLTIPFMVLPLRIALRRRGVPRGNIIIFALYYIAYIELLLMALYIGGVIFDYGVDAVRIPLLTVMFLYLTAALKHTFDIDSWIKSGIAALFINLFYILCCAFTITAIATVMILFIIL